MRRYGTARYGGYGDNYPFKEQPGAYQQQPPRLTDVARHTPPDVQPRSPSRPMELPQPGETFHPYNTFDALRYGSFKTLPFSIGTVDTIVLDKATDIRIYLFIINTHPLNDLFLNFQAPATPLTTPISPARGFYEFLMPVPQDAIHLIASAAGTTGVLVFTERDPRVLNRQPGAV